MSEHHKTHKTSHKQSLEQLKKMTEIINETQNPELKEQNLKSK